MAITPYIGILYMMSITLLLVVLGVRRILLNYYGYTGFMMADLKAASERFAHEIICWD